MGKTFRYKLGRELGSGAFGQVYETSRGGKTVAIKLLKTNARTAPQIQKLAMREFRYANLINHLNVVRNYEYISEASIEGQKNGEKVACLVSEHIQGALLFDILLDKESFDEDMCRSIFLQLFQAIDNIHKNGLVHGDIKLENIMLNKQGLCKIIDFGLAYPNQSGQEQSRQQGTQGYVTPELVQGEVYDGQMQDLFALGVVLFSLCTGNAPFELADPDQDYWYGLIKREDFAQFWNKHPYDRVRSSQISDEFKDLINGMLCRDPRKRLTKQEILAHNWLQSQVKATPQDIRQVVKTYLQSTRKSDCDAQNSATRHENGYVNFTGSNVMVSDKLKKKRQRAARIALKKTKCISKRRAEKKSQFRC